MKREHKSEQSYIDWLKSLGCVFYAPLNGVNDTMDVINNVQLTTTGYGAYSYDAAKDMYLITTPSNYNQHIGKWANGIETSTFPNDTYTFLSKAQRKDTSQHMSCGISLESTNYRARQAWSPMRDSTSGMWAWSNGDVFYNGFVFNVSGGYRDTYLNGEVQYHQSIFNEYKPSIWYPSSSGICFGRNCGTFNQIQLNAQLWIGEVYLFNTALTQQEIKEVQGL